MLPDGLERGQWKWSSFHVGIPSLYPIAISNLQLKKWTYNIPWGPFTANHEYPRIRPR